MAQHLDSPNWRHLKGKIIPVGVKENLDDPFARMGHPISSAARRAAYRHCKEMGCNSEQAFTVVNAVAGQLERDNPYDAMSAGCQILDLTGTYRLFAVLLATPADSEPSISLEEAHRLDFGKKK